MAQGPTKFGKKKDVFGTLTFSGTEIEVKLLHADQEVQKYSIDHGNWRISF